MDYEGQICRGPLERSSFMLPVTVGCPYNRCIFCDLFTHLKYREIDFIDIEKEVLRVKKLGGNPKRVFLGDGSAFSLSFNKLNRILKLLRENFTALEMVNLDATITSIKMKSDDELKELFKAGIRVLYIGIESGLDETLLKMDKDHNIKEAEIQIGRLKKAGIQYAAHFMTGVSGEGKGEENAKALAKFIEKNTPVSMINFSIFLSSNKLLKDIENGIYKPSTELENLMEDKIFLENLNLSEDKIVYDSYHDFIHLHFKGTLPKDKERLIKEMNGEIKKLKNNNPIYSNHNLMEKLGYSSEGLGFLNREYIGLTDVYEKKE